MTHSISKGYEKSWNQQTNIQYLNQIYDSHQTTRANNAFCLSLVNCNLCNLYLCLINNSLKQNIRQQAIYREKLQVQNHFASKYLGTPIYSILTFIRTRHCHTPNPMEEPLIKQSVNYHKARTLWPVEKDTIRRIYFIPWVMLVFWLIVTSVDMSL